MVKTGPLNASAQLHDILTPSRMEMRPVSYILICQSYPPVLGGSEAEAQHVSDKLQRRGYRPRIVCAGGAPMPAVGEWVDPFGLRVRIGLFPDVRLAIGDRAPGGAVAEKADRHEILMQQPGGGSARFFSGATRIELSASLGVADFGFESGNG
jgi:hypothetical protein